MAPQWQVTVLTKPNKNTKGHEMQFCAAAPVAEDDRDFGKMELSKEESYV